MHSAGKKRRSCLALLFAAGDVTFIQPWQVYINKITNMRL